VNIYVELKVLGKDSINKDHDGNGVRGVMSLKK
jgi:hypothetical protein